MRAVQQVDRLAYREIGMPFSKYDCAPAAILESLEPQHRSAAAKRETVPISREKPGIIPMIFFIRGILT